ncbi:DUF2156 domain-containing protein [Anaeromicropila herbilytica]|uniref:Phosphatidylglycerol lysyltransferase C-terminal domain-containing protein n=1 Tax=Anaeromicropila herbilytica TaxID=2785025 RepID=A0A7R7ICD7_9FIRM|nr:phosphatidylglycerol lysyltransferase domain-containing protein [Anaeromicropila herbilytica]BCN29809.1 hypothetical protein bsdtb5_11040 [Anaeromicropila herbilytica]
MTCDCKKLSVDSKELIEKYSNMRTNYTSERQFLNQFIWANYYNTCYYEKDDYLFYKMTILGETSTMMPLCKDDRVISSFFEIKDFFNKELNLPFKMHNVDDYYLDILKSSERFNKEFDIIEDRDSFDYLYDAEKLKTLSGRAYHKKKNHLNSFLKQYEGRYEYRTLCCSDIHDIVDFHEHWLHTRTISDKYQSISSEEEGLHNIFQNCCKLCCNMGGVYIDGKLQAYSIGSYASDIECAFIHIEKANVEIPGLYNYINQQFLSHEFPDAKIVNREDDLGQEGLRKAKMSYNPIRMINKYHLIEKQ